jgi:hypothetical protein
MRVAEARAPIFWRSQRWQQVAWALAPQIHLAISPLLRVTAAGGAPMLGPGLTQTIFLQPAPSAIERQGTQPAMENRQRIEARSPTPLGNRQRIEARPPTPLELVLQRVEVSEAATHLNRTLVANESVQIVQRLSEAWQRVEVRPPRAMVTPWLNETAPAAEPGASFDSPRPLPRNARFKQANDDGFSARGRQMEAESSWPPAPPAINLDQLTDQVMRQIDHRLIAYRERLGKGV